MPNRLLRAAAALAAVGFVTACQMPDPTAANNAVPEVAAAPSPDVQAQAPAAKREAQQITVERGQSLSRLAAKYGIRQRAIIAANKLEPPYKIKIGQRLLIPGDDRPPPAPSVAAATAPAIIPLDPPARPEATTPPPAAATAPAPADSAITATALAAPAANKTPEPAPPPVTPVAARASAPPPAETPAPPASVAVAAPAAASAETAVAPAPAPATAAAAPPPGVTCPFGTTGMWSEDVIKKPVYVCRRPQSHG